MGRQLTIFDEMFPEFEITKPIRLIELFAGYGSQAMALKRVGANFEHYRCIEFDKYAINSYNAVHGTDFEPTDIKNVHASDMEITDTDKFCYIMTYSFPCTDLSVAGKMKGMKKGSGTRSGLLWEVERLLKEMDEKPQVLLMENVPQVHGKKNLSDFEEWIRFLESLGYRNYWQDLNAKNFGVPQNRNRCFMVSLLGDYVYHFPNSRREDHKLADLLEKTVDEKYYLNSAKAKKLIEQLIVRNVLTGQSISLKRMKSLTAYVQDTITELENGNQKETWLLSESRMEPKKAISNVKMVECLIAVTRHLKIEEEGFKTVDRWYLP